jgi:hypothetical protein
MGSVGDLGEYRVYNTSTGQPGDVITQVPISGKCEWEW